jgi:hypothetical protein
VHPPLERAPQQDAIVCEFPLQRSRRTAKLQMPPSSIITATVAKNVGGIALQLTSPATGRVLENIHENWMDTPRLAPRCHSLGPCTAMLVVLKCYYPAWRMVEHCS